MEEKEEIKETPKKKTGLFSIFACIMTGLIVFLAVNIGNMIGKIVNPDVTGGGKSENNESLEINFSKESNEEYSNLDYSVSEEGIIEITESTKCVDNAEPCLGRPIYTVKGLKEGTVTAVFSALSNNYGADIIKKQMIYEISVDKDLKISEKHNTIDGIIVELGTNSTLKEKTTYTIDSGDSVKVEEKTIENFDGKYYVISKVKQGTSKITFTQTNTETNEVKKKIQYVVTVQNDNTVSEYHYEVGDNILNIIYGYSPSAREVDDFSIESGDSVVVTKEAIPYEKECAGCSNNTMYTVKPVKEGRTVLKFKKLNNYGYLENDEVLVYIIDVDSNLKISEKHYKDSFCELVEFSYNSSAAEKVEYTISDPTIASVTLKVLEPEDKTIVGQEEKAFYVIKGLKEGTAEVTFTKTNVSTNKVERQEKYKVTVKSTKVGNVTSTGITTEKIK